eukprot:364723-Chlamydomonas_euryale.AAC.4
MPAGHLRHLSSGCTMPAGYLQADGGIQTRQMLIEAPSAFRAAATAPLALSSSSTRPLTSGRGLRLCGAGAGRRARRGAATQKVAPGIPKAQAPRVICIRECGGCVHRSRGRGALRRGVSKTRCRGEAALRRRVAQQLTGAPPYNCALGRLPTGRLACHFLEQQLTGAPPYNCALERLPTGRLACHFLEQQLTGALPYTCALGRLPTGRLACLFLEQQLTGAPPYNYALGRLPTGRLACHFLEQQLMGALPYTCALGRLPTGPPTCSLEQPACRHRLRRAAKLPMGPEPLLHPPTSNHAAQRQPAPARLRLHRVQQPGPARLRLHRRWSGVRRSPPLLLHRQLCARCRRLCAASAHSPHPSRPSARPEARAWHMPPRPPQPLRRLCSAAALPALPPRAPSRRHAQQTSPMLRAARPRTAARPRAAPGGPPCCGPTLPWPQASLRGS